MRRATTIQYHQLATVCPVRHKTLDKQCCEVTVTRRYRWDGLYTTADTRAVLAEMAENGQLQGYGRVNLRKLTVGGESVKAVPVRPAMWPQDYFTAAEIDAPQGYRWWEVVAAVGAPVVRLTMLFPSDHKREIAGETPLGKRIVADPRYLPTIFREVPAGWLVVEPFVGHITDLPRAKPADYEAALRRMLADDDQWQVEQALGSPEWDECVKHTFPRRGKWKRPAKQVEVTGQRLKPADKCLYRVLHYFCGGGKYNPKTQRDSKGIRIDDFYKGGFLRLEHPTLPAWVWLEFWKCELVIRLFADPGICQQRKPEACIRAGEPGAQSDEWQAQKAVLAWYRLLVRVLWKRTCIYGGNEFYV